MNLHPPNLGGMAFRVLFSPFFAFLCFLAFSPLKKGLQENKDEGSLGLRLSSHTPEARPAGRIAGSCGEQGLLTKRSIATLPTLRHTIITDKNSSEIIVFFVAKSRISRVIREKVFLFWRFRRSKIPCELRKITLRELVIIAIISCQRVHLFIFIAKLSLPLSLEKRSRYLCRSMLSMCIAVHWWLGSPAVSPSMSQDPSSIRFPPWQGARKLPV